MPRPLRLPPRHKLPAGPKRDFAENLFAYLKVANRPTLQEISDRIKQRDDLPGTASKETLRRMFQGEAVPLRWNNAHSVFLVLCELAGVRPDEPYDKDDQDSPTHEEHYGYLWNRALDEPDEPNISVFSDEPPF